MTKILIVFHEKFKIFRMIYNKSLQFIVYFHQFNWVNSEITFLFTKALLGFLFIFYWVIEFVDSLTKVTVDQPLLLLLLCSVLEHNLSLERWREKWREMSVWMHFKKVVQRFIFIQNIYFLNYILTMSEKWANFHEICFFFIFWCHSSLHLLGLAAVSFLGSMGCELDQRSSWGEYGKIRK